MYLLILIFGVRLDTDSYEQHVVFVITTVAEVALRSGPSWSYPSAARAASFKLSLMESRAARESSTDRASAWLV